MDACQRNHYETRNRRLLVALLLLGFLSSVGCRSLHDEPVLIPKLPVPRELEKITMPDYVIEPPDILAIGIVHVVPKAPYHLNPLDVVHVSAIGPNSELLLDSDFTVQPNGDVQLGMGFGTIQAAGLTMRDFEMMVSERLKAEVKDPTVWSALVQITSQQQLAGEHLVAPDGTINLGHYGRVRVVGMTVEEAKAAIEMQLAQHLENPQVALDVFGYNSKVYYVISQGAGLGDQVTILPLKGNETVLDAIGQVEGLSSVSSTEMWIARPNMRDCPPRILPIDWCGITQSGDATTNYQILPGDRLYVAEDKMVAMDTWLGKFLAPVERVAATTLLLTESVQRLKFFHRYPAGGGFGRF